MSIKEQNLIKLLRAINDDNRTVCWNKEQWLDRGVNDRQNYFVSIYHKGSCRVQLSFESPSLDDIILEVSIFIGLNKITSVGATGTYSNVVPFEPF